MVLKEQFNNLYKAGKSGFLGGTDFGLKKRLEYEVSFLLKFIKNNFNRKVTVLSIGCGDFSIENKLYELGCIKKIVGIDISDEVIMQNKKKFKNNNSYTFYNTDILDFKLDKEYYDIIFFGGVLMYNDKKRLYHILDKIKGKSNYIIARESCVSYANVVINKDFHTFYRKKQTYKKIFINTFGNVRYKFNWGYYNVITYGFIKKYNIPCNIIIVWILNLIRLLKNFFCNDLYNYFFIINNNIENDKENT